MGSFLLAPNIRLCVASLRKSLGGLWPSSLYAVDHDCLATAQLSTHSQPPLPPRGRGQGKEHVRPQNRLQSPLGTATSCVGGPFGRNGALILNTAPEY